MISGFPRSNTVRRYEPKDFEQIQKWLDARDCQRFESHLMPAFGQIADGVAAGFVKDTNAGFSVLDYFCTNPKASVVARIKATKEMLDGAMLYSEECGYKSAIGNTRNRGMIRYAKRIGWKMDETPYYLFRKNLTEPGEKTPVVRLYQESDFEMVSEWLCDRRDFFHGSGPLPKLGVIVDGLGCAFLIETNCGEVILDAFATNRDAQTNHRIRAAGDLTQAIQRIAFLKGYKVITGSTKSLRGMSLLCKYGFSYDPRPYFFLRKTLKGAMKDERRERGTIRRSGDAAATGIDER